MQITQVTWLGLQMSLSGEIWPTIYQPFVPHPCSGIMFFGPDKEKAVPICTLAPLVAERRTCFHNQMELTAAGDFVWAPKLKCEKLLVTCLNF